MKDSKRALVVAGSNSMAIHMHLLRGRSHPNSADIYKELDRLMVEIRKLGCLADTSFALHDLEQEEKENTLLYHSEKLAIAFRILKLRNGEAILVTKNLRVCGDCHEAIKYIFGCKEEYRCP